ncbi:MAG TPA: nucleotidyltransferase family protein [Thermoanaerobaculia bacterium]|jgi:hypothetical protein
MNPGDFYAALDPAVATREGVGPLVARELRRRGAAVPEALAAESRQLVTVEVLRERELDALLAAFDRAAVDALIIKGTALAYTLYDHPSLRPRCDTDLVVRRGDGRAAAQILTALGYTAESGNSGTIVNAQRIFTRVDALGLRHSVDLHLEISNRPRFARAFDFDALRARGERFRDSQRVRVPSAVDALLLAAVHLAGHHCGEERLIWLHDIHLLAGIVDWPEVMRTAREKRVLRELARGLAAATAMETRATGRPSAMRQFAADFRELSGVADRVRFVREHALPPAEHVLHKYGATSRLLLPFLYCRRAMGLFRAPVGYSVQSAAKVHHRAQFAPMKRANLS